MRIEPYGFFRDSGRVSSQGPAQDLDPRIHMGHRPNRHRHRPLDGVQGLGQFQRSGFRGPRIARRWRFRREVGHHDGRIRQGEVGELPRHREEMRLLFVGGDFDGLDRVEGERCAPANDRRDAAILATGRGAFQVLPRFREGELVDVERKPYRDRVAPRRKLLRYEALPSQERAGIGEWPQPPVLAGVEQPSMARHQAEPGRKSRVDPGNRILG